MKWYANVHFEKARFNYGFSMHIAGLGDEYGGWRVTVLFYSAVHVIEAYLVERQGHGTKSHIERSDAIRKMGRLIAIEKSYAYLEELSRAARYATTPIFPDEVARAVANHESIYNHIAALLGEPPLHLPAELEKDVTDAENASGS